MRALHAALAAATLLGAAVAASFLASGGEVTAAAPAQGRPVVDQALLERGEALARLGNCEVCHSAQGGKPYAGGHAVVTPFGRIYSTNITPDRETGIGAWSFEDFRRAMREGVRRNGEHLYPAFPYTQFAKTTDRDLEALYAWLRTVPEVKAANRTNELSFPFNQRALLAGWKWLFHDASPFNPVAGRSEQWNEGAYYVASVGHCGACHSPRNRLGGERRGESLAGGWAGDYFSPAISAKAKPVLQWTEKAMLDYLVDGRHPHHGIAAGPMQLVVDQLAKLPESMVEAMAHYLTDGASEARDQARILKEAQQREFVPGRQQHPPDTLLGRGEAVFAKSCSNCHRAGSSSTPLALTTSVTGPDPRTLIRLTLDGIRPPEGSPDKSMPKFSSLSDEDLTVLVLYMRDRFAPGAGDGDVARLVVEARRGAR
jgi:nicotinate dehydrogenase subunit B